MIWSGWTGDQSRKMNVQQITVTRYAAATCFAIENSLQRILMQSYWHSLFWSVNHWTLMAYFERILTRWTGVYTLMWSCSWWNTDRYGASTFFFILRSSWWSFRLILKRTSVSNWTVPEVTMKQQHQTYKIKKKTII